MPLPHRYQHWNEQLWTENRHLQQYCIGFASAANGNFSLIWDLRPKQEKKKKKKTDNADGSLQKSQGITYCDDRSESALRRMLDIKQVQKLL